MCHNIECIILLIRCGAALQGFPFSSGQLSPLPHQPRGAQCPPRRNGRADGYILEARTGPSDMSSSFEIPTAVILSEAKDPCSCPLAVGVNSNRRDPSLRSG